MLTSQLPFQNVFYHCAFPVNKLVYILNKVSMCACTYVCKMEVAIGLFFFLQ